MLFELRVCLLKTSNNIAHVCNKHCMCCVSINLVLCSVSGYGSDGAGQTDPN